MFRSCVDIAFPGYEVLSACSSDTSSCGTNQYIRSTGTSMAAPAVAGILAQFLEKMNKLELNFTNEVTFFDKIICNRKFGKIISS